jgi:hypothetical protein
MACAQYKLFFNDQVATAAQLTSFETITVQQEMDHAWTASLEIPLCTNAQGDWTGESETWFTPLNRLRIEVNLQGQGYVPLIDGVIINRYHDLYMEPGQSIGHVEVHDDSFCLHRDDVVKLYPGITDDQIARQIYGDFTDVIKSIDVDSVPPPKDLSSNTTVMSGTAMELLKTLAGRHKDAYHAFVLPGSLPHTSIGCLKPDSIVDSGLDDMILTGKCRTLLNIKFTNTAATQAKFRGSSISLNSATPDASTANLSQISRLGSNPPGGTPANRMLRPGQSRNVDLQNATASASQEAAFALRAEGEVLKDTYGSVLQPYQTVNVLGSNGQLSGLWQIYRVTHTLTRNSYGQTFTLRRDAQSAGTGSAKVAPPVPIF